MCKLDTPDNKGINRSSNDYRALGLGISRQTYVNTTNAVILYVIRPMELDSNLDGKSDLHLLYLQQKCRSQQNGYA